MDRQRVGRRLPTARRGAGVMSGALTATGWTVAFACAALAALALARLREREELVARGCRELRSPLTAARLAVHALGTGAAAPRPVAVIDLELRRAGLALEDLAAAREGGRARELAEVLEAHELVEAVAESWRPVARAMGVELDVGPVAPGLLVRGDRLRLAQGLGNLVGNALEHGGSPVTLRTRAGVGDSIRFEVHDAGVGLPAPVAELA